jgi:hypothetical protein
LLLDVSLSTVIHAVQRQVQRQSTPEVETLQWQCKGVTASPNRLQQFFHCSVANSLTDKLDLQDILARRFQQRSRIDLVPSLPRRPALWFQDYRNPVVEFSDNLIDVLVMIVNVRVPSHQAT